MYILFLSDHITVIEEDTDFDEHHGVLARLLSIKVKKLYHRIDEKINIHFYIGNIFFIKSKYIIMYSPSELTKKKHKFICSSIRLKNKQNILSFSW
jgi:hypothetical protein